MEQNEADKAFAEQKRDSGGCPRGCGGVKGSNKILVAIWVVLLLGGVSCFTYSQQKKAAEANRLLNEAQMLYGRGDFAGSTDLLRQSAELGNAWAQLYYGERLRNGFYAEQDFAEAVKWLRKAAKKGCAEAFFQLGMCYENGEGVERNLNEAETWYRKAQKDAGFAYDARTALERLETMKRTSGAGID
ncbi:MAG: sel1 repeat family protein [Lentisphaeria bacterium]|jgi:tetratricopeptide (TPR) repeat protein|nr:sel1 repeat family protein [Lentisphaeria bacterium]